jgi:hypothetical protein
MIIRCAYFTRLRFLGYRNGYLSPMTYAFIRFDKRILY